MAINWNESVELIKLKIINNIPIVMVSIFIYIIFYIVANYCKNFFISDYVLSEQSLPEKTLYNTSLVNNQIGWMLYYTILITGIIFAIVNLGINIATILTILAAIGLAFGLALQGTLSNIIAGIIITINNLFNINDSIKMNQILTLNYIEGIVVEFNLYYTTLLDKKTNLLITVPNSIIQASLITNITRSNLIFSKKNIKDN